MLGCLADPASTSWKSLAACLESPRAAAICASVAVLSTSLAARSGGFNRRASSLYSGGLVPVSEKDVADRQVGRPHPPVGRSVRLQWRSPTPAEGTESPARSRCASGAWSQFRRVPSSARAGGRCARNCRRRFFCSASARSYSPESSEANAGIVQRSSVDASLFEIAERQHRSNRGNASSKRSRTSRLMPRLLMASASRKRSPRPIAVSSTVFSRCSASSQRPRRRRAWLPMTSMSSRRSGSPAAIAAAASRVSSAGCNCPRVSCTWRLEVLLPGAQAVELIARRHRRFEILESGGNLESCDRDLGSQQPNSPRRQRVRRRLPSAKRPDRRVVCAAATCPRRNSTCASVTMRSTRASVFAQAHAATTAIVASQPFIAGSRS